MVLDHVGKLSQYVLYYTPHKIHASVVKDLGSSYTKILTFRWVSSLSNLICVQGLIH